MAPVESITGEYARGRLRNLVLSALPEVELGLLLRSASEIHLRAGTVLFAEGDEINDVYFPETGLVSLCIETRDGRCASWRFSFRRVSIQVKVSKHSSNA